MTVTVLRPMDRLADYGKTSRDYACPSCGRFLFASTSETGGMRVKCPDCNAWKTIPVGPDHGQPSRKGVLSS